MHLSVLVPLLVLLLYCTHAIEKSKDVSTTLKVSKKASSKPKVKGKSKKDDDFVHHKMTKDESVRKIVKIENDTLKIFDENKDGYLDLGELQKMAIAEEEMEKIINGTKKKKLKDEDPTKKIMKDWKGVDVRSGVKKVFFGSLDLNKDGFITMKEGMTLVGNFIKKKYNDNKDKIVDLLKGFLIKKGFMMLLGAG